MNREKLVEASLKRLLTEMPASELEHLVARRGNVSAKDYLDALARDIQTAVKRLESKASKYHRDDEEKLTGFIAERLEAQGHQAECEADNNGHVDLKVTKPQLGVLYLAEAKIHTSYPKNVKGMLQLLTRYSSGKDPLAGFLLYIRSPGAKRIVDTWRSKVRCKRLSCTNVTSVLRPGYFESTHKHTSGHELSVGHYCVFIHYKPQDTPTTKRKKGKKRR
jgi:hypothetical protein